MLLLLAASFFATPALPTHSQGAGAPITGFAWSGTVGWISLHCQTGGASGENICATKPYGLGVESGNITGYAWSDMVGWIKFGGLSGFPSGPGTTAANAALSGSTISGWARACEGTASPGDCSSMTAQPGGWDGWISLRGTGYGVGYTGSSLNGYAWGSDVMSYIDFSYATANLTPPTCSISSVTPSSYYEMAPPASVVLSYSTTESPTSGSISGTSCTVDLTAGLKNCTIPAPTAPGSHTYTLTATNASGTCTPPPNNQGVVTVTNGWPPPTGQLSIGQLSPVVEIANIKRGDSASLYWDITYIATPNDCSLTKNGASVEGEPSTAANTAGWSTGPITEHSEYVLRCTGESGAIFTDTAVINIIPEFEEI